jgi:hypothetical protein
VLLTAAAALRGLDGSGFWDTQTHDVDTKDCAKCIYTYSWCTGGVADGGMSGRRYDTMPKALLIDW